MKVSRVTLSKVMEVQVAKKWPFMKPVYAYNQMTNGPVNYDTPRQYLNLNQTDHTLTR